MKKLSLVLLSVVLLSVTSCDFISKSKEGNAPNVEQTDSLQRIISQKDNEINDMMETFNQIQTGLREISEAENRVTVAQTGEGASSRKQMLEDVRFISSTMQQNRALLEKLRQQLRESSIKGDQLRRTIDELVAQINDKEQQLQQLRAELDAKNIHIATSTRPSPALTTTYRRCRRSRRRRLRLSTTRTHSSTPHGSRSAQREN